MMHTAAATGRSKNEIHIIEYKITKSGVGPIQRDPD